MSVAAHIRRINVTRRYASAVVHNGTINLVEVADDETLGFAEQVKQCLHQVESTLALASSDKHHLLQVLIYVKHLSDVPVLNEIWDSWVPEGHAPVRACVQANLVNEKFLVEFVVSAAVKL
ncbi:endoribonuclease L-PSP [Obelidium mucronatum]|nr:endoribonuclease L-PSP [Obelidium mucronatum]